MLNIVNIVDDVDYKSVACGIIPENEVPDDYIPSYSEEFLINNEKKIFYIQRDSDITPNDSRFTGLTFKGYYSGFPEWITVLTEILDLTLVNMTTIIR